jgi:hypothetical protein
MRAVLIADAIRRAASMTAARLAPRRFAAFDMVGGLAALVLRF